MGIGFIFIIWVLAGAIFFAKVLPVRELVMRLRREPVFIQITTVLFLCIAVIHASTKTNNHSNALSGSGTSSAPPMPAWWQGDDTDTDGDGIPDLWEKWTHGNPLVADSHLDRDGDGLTGLEEFHNQTDPRTADTDGDGLSDYIEVSHGMDPLRPADFTPDEPDIDGGGVIDLWQGCLHHYDFIDRDGNGFDDRYEDEDMPPASDSNFDVVVDVYTSRSAVLAWTNSVNSGGIILMATTGTQVKLRLPFGVDTRLKLLPAPEGVAPPAGELWKSRMLVSFAPRPGQGLNGNALVAHDGAIAHKITDVEETAEVFPPAAPEGGFSPLSTTGGGGGRPGAKIVYLRMGVKPESAAWHFAGELIGPFVVTNYAGALPNRVEWSSEYLDIRTPNENTTFVCVTPVPPPGEDTIVLRAACELDDVSYVTNRAFIPKCIRQDFALVSATQNFSPHLGEAATFQLDLPGCPHFPPQRWLEGEVTRRAAGGWQHVGWIDMDPDEAGHQKRIYPSLQHTVIWDGMATEGAAQVESAFVFKAGREPFRGILPVVDSGEPVPPPYYTVFLRLRENNHDKSQILDETSTTVYVPQVVGIEMTEAAFQEFKEPLLYPETVYPHLLGATDVVGCETNSVIWPASPNAVKTDVVESIVAKCQGQIPNDVNLRFTSRNVAGRHKRIQIVVKNDSGNVLGGTKDFSWRNENPEGVGYVYSTKTRNQMCFEKNGVENGFLSPHGYDSRIYPCTKDEQAYSLASIAVHETGHMLGLVGNLIYGTKSRHNGGVKEDGFIMNTPRPFSQIFGKPYFPKNFWKLRNHQYLIFILPKPQDNQT